MSLVAAAVLAGATVATGYQLFQVVAAWRFLRRARRGRRAGILPPVTVLKPLKGLGVELYENLATFCRQSYPSYQIVFGVADAHDPAVAVVQRLRRDLPAAAPRLRRRTIRRNARQERASAGQGALERLWSRPRD